MSHSDTAKQQQCNLFQLAKQQCCFQHKIANACKPHSQANQCTARVLMHHNYALVNQCKTFTDFVSIKKRDFARGPNNSAEGGLVRE